MDKITCSINRIMKAEERSIAKVRQTISDSSVSAIELLLKSKGKVVFTGVGKSGHIGRKLAATFSSTGTPAFFVHATEGVHGDLGMISKEDTVIFLSNSGETNEVCALLPSIEVIGCATIAITGSENSTLARFADVAIELYVELEADSLNLAPSNSSTVVLSYGDALALTLAELKGFGEEQFHLFHPGGKLGEKLSQL
jgi:arabinose-5-phosphate isomerase